MASKLSLHSVPLGHWARLPFPVDTQYHFLADQFVEHFVRPNVDYICRWMLLKGATVNVHGLIRASSDKTAVMVGNTVCSCRGEVAIVLNRLWIELSSKLGIEPPTEDELLELGLHATTAALRPDDESLLDAALAEGERNPWIRRASDPPFNRRSFRRAPNIAALEHFFLRGNWSLGTAIVFGKLAFINQVDGGDEWLAVREDVGQFESLSTCLMMERDHDAIRRFCIDCEAATALQLKLLDYVGASGEATSLLQDGAVARASSSSQVVQMLHS